MEAEDRMRRNALRLRCTPDQSAPLLARIRIDMVVGMGVSNLVAIFLIYATAATLHATGIITIHTSFQAAEALRRIAGAFTFVIFATGIIGTGLLTVPILAGTSAYALAEASRWPEG